MTHSIRTATHSLKRNSRRIAAGRLALLAAAGAALLIAGCAAPSTTDPAASPAATVSTAASAEAPAAPQAAEASPEASPVPVETQTVESVAAPAPAAEPAPAPVETQPAQQPAPAAPTAEAPAAEAPAPAAPAGYGCDAAIAYLSAHAHPAFTIVCPGYAFGGQAVTCFNHAPQCANSAVIIINVPCPVAYMNEAANSWTIYNGTGATIDPYGSSC